MKMEVFKTVKMFVGGQFIRSESERTMPFIPSGSNAEFARICLASRKDIRNAVTASKSALDGWGARSAYNRSQILYRAAEMLQGRSSDVINFIVETQGLPEEVAKKEVEESIDTFIYYAGFCDKFQSLLGGINPVNGPYHNFTFPEAMGVVFYVQGEDATMVDLVDSISSLICGGNVVIALINSHYPVLATLLGEVFATSDFPAGVVNLLTGGVDELVETISTHMEIQAIAFDGSVKIDQAKLKEASVQNLKRIHFNSELKKKSLEKILNFVEQKTIWHPIGV